VKLFHDWDPREAEAAFNREVGLDPDNASPLGRKALLFALHRPPGGSARSRSSGRSIGAALADEPCHAGPDAVSHRTIRRGSCCLQAVLYVWPDSAELHLWLGVVLGYVDRHEEAESSSVMPPNSSAAWPGSTPPGSAAWRGWGVRGARGRSSTSFRSSAHRSARRRSGPGHAVRHRRGVAAQGRRPSRAR
jgi:hypothetical protein